MIFARMLIMLLKIHKFLLLFSIYFFVIMLNQWLQSIKEAFIDSEVYTKMEKYEIKNELGGGSFGKVFLAKIIKTDELCAIKEINMSLLADEQKEKAFQEVQFLASLKHPNIVSHIESFQENGNLYIVMEYVDGGDLSHKIAAAEKPFTEDQILSIFIQICLALRYVHDQKIVHRDIKPQNVFLTKVNVVKLGDFGVARTLENSQDLAHTVIGTPFYLSPEIWSNAPYNSKTDIWSLGCILYEMCALKRPFQGRTAQQLFAAVIRGHYEKLSRDYSQSLRNLVYSMLSPNPVARPSAAHILKLPFIQKHAAAMVQQNEETLKKVNVTKPKVLRKRKPSLISKQKSPSKSPLNQKLKEKVPEKVKLPLPDEEPPLWARRGLQKDNEGKPSYFVEDGDDVRSEWDDLRQMTEELQGTLSRDAPLPDNREEAEAERAELEAALIESLGSVFYNLAKNNMIDSDQETCKEFARAFKERDLFSYQQMRRLLSLEKFLNKK